MDLDRMIDLLSEARDAGLTEEAAHIERQIKALTAPDWKPPTPEEMDASLSARRGPMERGPQPEPSVRLSDVPRLIGQGGSFGTMPSLAAAIDASAPWLAGPLNRALGGYPASDETTWEQRYRTNRARIKGEVAQSRRNLPNAGPLIEMGAGLGTGLAAGGVLAPISALTKGAPLAARMVAGTADAALINGLSRGVERAGAEGGSLGQGFEEGFNEGADSKWNWLGAAAPMIGETLGPLADRAGRRSALKAAQAADPNRRGVEIWDTSFGQGRQGQGTVQAGEILRRLRLPNGEPVVAAGDTAVEIANKLKALDQHVGANKGAVVDDLTAMGVKVPAGELVARLRQVVNEELHATDQLVHPGSDAARGVMGEFLDRVDRLYNKTGAVPVSTNVEYPPPPQGNLPFSTMEQPTAIDVLRRPDRVVPPGEPVQTGLGLPGSDPRKIPWGERRPDLEIPPGEPVQTGLGEPLPGFGPANQVGQQGHLFSGYDVPPAPTPGGTQPTGWEPSTAVQRNSFTGYELPPAPTAGEVIPGEVLATELARQLRLGNRGPAAFPEEGAVTPTSTNIEWQKGMVPLDKSERLKTSIDNEVYNSSSPMDRTPKAIDANPVTRTYQRTRGVISDFDKEVADALSLEDGARLRQANNEVSAVKDLQKVTQHSATDVSREALAPANEGNLRRLGRDMGYASIPVFAGHTLGGWRGALAGAGVSAAGWLAPKLVPAASTQSRAYGALEEALRAYPGYKLDPAILNAALAQHGLPQIIEQALRRTRKPKVKVPSIDFDPPTEEPTP